MRKPFLALLLLAINFAAFSQSADTLTPEKKARYKINRLGGSRSNAREAAISAPVDSRAALDAIVDMAAHRVPFFTQKEVRAGMADTARVIYVNEGLRSGTFRFSPENTKDRDDSSMVIVAGNRRYVREDIGYVRPEWFGADPNDKLDDAPAIQRMLNSATIKGLNVEFSSGNYLVGSTITLKNVTGKPEFYYRLNLNGKGAARTYISGILGFKGDMFFINTGINGGNKANYITIQNLQFNANGANRIIYGTHVVGMKVYDCTFSGGEDCGIQIGERGGSESYSVYFKNNYHNGQAYGAGQIKSLMRLYSARMFVIDGMETDGGRYAIEMLGNSDKNIIINGKMEGSKRAGIFMDNTGGGGGENQILNNTINPYIGIEAKALFDGEMNCIEINSRAGANGFNTIRGNLLLCNDVGTLPFIATVKDNSGTFLVSPDAKNQGIDGQTSGAHGYLAGYDAATKKLIIQVIKGKFQEGETVKQRQTNATAVVAALIPKHSHAIKLTGGAGSNIIAENRIRLLPEYGIYNESDNNVILGNVIEASNGVYSVAPSGAVVGNNAIYSPGGTAVNQVKGTLSYSNNRIVGGKLVGVSEPAATPSAAGTASRNTTSPTLPVYPDNKAATAAGLANGTMYRTATGELKVKF